jgi:hypothetical protein
LSVGEDSVDFCDDFRGGGLGGRGESPFFVFFFSADSEFFGVPPPFTVEFEEDEVTDSCNDGNPWVSTAKFSASVGMLPALLLVTGGRLKAGLPCRSLGVGVLEGAITPGD